MIKFTTMAESGSLLDSQVELLINPVNLRGVMGRGLALEFSRRNPGMLGSYQRACRSGDLRVGTVYAWLCPNGWQRVVNIPTKVDWRQPSTLEIIDAGLSAFVCWVSHARPPLERHSFAYLNPRRSFDSAAFPALGCGLGGLDWGQIKPLMVKHLEPLTINCTVWEPG